MLVLSVVFVSTSGFASPSSYFTSLISSGIVSITSSLMPWFPKSPSLTVNVPGSLGSSRVLLQIHDLPSSNTTSLLTTIRLVVGSNNLYALEPGSFPRCIKALDLSSSFRRCGASYLSMSNTPKHSQVLHAWFSSFKHLIWCLRV